MAGKKTYDIHLRTHKCPICGRKSLIGYDLQPRPDEIEFSTILRPLLPQSCKLQNGLGPVETRAMDVIHLYICPYDLAVHRGRYQLGLERGGLVDEIAWAAKRNQRERQRKAMIERSLLLIFGNRKGAEAGRIMAERAVRGGMVDQHLSSFELLELTSRIEHLLTTTSNVEFEAGIESLNKLSTMPLVSTIMLESYRDLDSIQTLLDLERIYLMEALARENHLQLPADIYSDTLEATLRMVQAIYNSPVLEPWTLRRLLTNLLSTAQILGEEEQVSYNTLMAARRCVICIMRFGDISYDDPKIIAARVEQNNEAMRYLWLVLRKMLGGEQEGEPNADKVRERLDWALDSSGAYSYYGRTKGVSKAIRLGDLLRGHIKAYL